jgi:septum formation protein
MASEKAAAVAAAEPRALILAADTVVAAGRRILPKT